MGFSTSSLNRLRDDDTLTAVEPCDEFGEVRYGHVLGLLTYATHYGRSII